MDKNTQAPIALLANVKIALIFPEILGTVFHPATAGAKIVASRE